MPWLNKVLNNENMLKPAAAPVAIIRMGRMALNIRLHSPKGCRSKPPRLAPRTAEVGFPSGSKGIRINGSFGGPFTWFSFLFYLANFGREYKRPAPAVQGLCATSAAPLPVHAGTGAHANNKNCPDLMIR